MTPPKDKDSAGLDRAGRVARVRQSFFPHKFAPDSVLNEVVVSVFKTHIVRSYAPPAPLVPPTARVASIGSCFAEEISKSLSAQGIEVAFVNMSERWNSAFALSRFLENILFGVPFPDDFLTEANRDALPTDAGARFASADLFILTFGLSLCWFNRTTGQLVLEPGNSHSLSGLERALEGFEMRQTRMDDNEREILRCVDLVRKARPDATIVLTLSPVPLQAALCEVAPIPANIVSKATLRAALENATARQLDNVYYWPSYDFVMWFGGHIAAAFGGADRDMRHVRPELVNALAQLFKEAYFQG